MRKISKSRTDDDVVSSTNGSILNDDHQPAIDNDKDDDKDADFEADNGEVNNDSDASEARESAKKSKGKRGKKRKSTKEDKRNATDDENEDDGDSIKAKGKRGRKKKTAKEDKGSETEEEYEVEKVVDSKKIKGKLHYLIRWKGYSADSDTWEPENTLSCPDLISKYNEEKENSKKNRERPTKSLKRKGSKKESKSPKKKVKTVWESEDEADNTAEYEVERILEVHHLKKNGTREFLIHWKGWSNKFDSWEPESNLNCPELIKKFMEKVENAQKTDSRNLRVAPGSTNRFTLQVPSTGRRLSKRHNQRQRVRYDDAE